MRKIMVIGCLSILFFGLTGCGGRSAMESYSREDVDISFVQRIAVMPFQNNSDDKYAGALARNMTATQVLALGLFDVVDKDLVDSILFDEAIEPGIPLDPLTIKRIGHRLNAQALLMGSVDTAGMGKLGSTTYPETALTLRLVEADSGMVLWQVSGYFNGESFGRRLLGIKPDDAYEVTFKLVRKLLNTIPAP
jgi:TolB-like protein